MLKLKKSEKMKCPYCGEKQEYEASAYVTPTGEAIHENDCELCDQKFLVRKVGDFVYADANFTKANLLNIK